MQNQPIFWSPWDTALPWRRNLVGRSTPRARAAGSGVGIPRVPNARLYLLFFLLDKYPGPGCWLQVARLGHPILMAKEETERLSNGFLVQNLVVVPLAVRSLVVCYWSPCWVHMEVTTPLIHLPHRIFNITLHTPLAHLPHWVPKNMSHRGTLVLHLCFNWTDQQLLMCTSKEPVIW